MLTFPTKNLFIEGPDCSGKTTLVRLIHKKTGYKWHIHDRSQISRKIFAEMYNRDLPTIQSDYHLELSDLNNIFIFLITDPELIQERFLKRGDEIHDIVSLMSVWSKFSEEADRLIEYPNVLVVYSGDAEKISDMIIPLLLLLERPSLVEISEYLKKFVSETKNLESYPLQFTIFDDGAFEEATSNSLQYSSEKEYYEKIYRSFNDKIDKELAGENEYSRAENVLSRRFVYADDSCISFIQCAIRERMMDFNVVIRSSDIENTFEHDLQFLYFLASECYKRFESSCDTVRMRFNLNSAHFVR